MGYRWRLATEHRKLTAFSVTWITGLYDVWDLSGWICLYRLWVVYSFTHLNMQRLQRLTSLLLRLLFGSLPSVDKSPPVVDSAKRELVRLLKEHSELVPSCVEIVLVLSLLS